VAKKLGPNSGSTLTNQAGQAQDPSPECAKLKEENVDTQARLQASTKDQSVVGFGTTIASSTYKPDGGGSWTSQTAHNNAKAQNYSEVTGELAEGSGGPSKVNCKGVQHRRNPGMADQHAGHAEARMVDDLFAEGKGKPGRMTFNVDLWTNDRQLSKMPCANCHKMLCDVRRCGIKVFLCDAQNRKQEMTDEHCPVNRKTRQKLKATMGEGPPPKP
jgi:hypothetical protein